MHEAEYYTQRGEGRVQCGLCPRTCVLGEGESGQCRARVNTGGSMRLPFYGFLSSIAVDPIEKKPLREFLQGSQTFSVGFWHCTMHCPYCQNWEIAQPLGIQGKILDIDALISMAEASGTPSISFTYSEPCLHIEYVKLAMEAARKRGIRTVLVTNGNILPGPARDILELTDATNVDLKCFSSKTYHNILGGELETVENFIRIAHSLCHTEVTSLLVPGIFDEPGQMEAVSTFLASVSRDIPLHITSYHPAFRWNRPSLSAATTEAAAAPAFAKLNKVYLSAPWPR